MITVPIIEEMRKEKVRFLNQIQRDLDGESLALQRAKDILEMLADEDRMTLSRHGFGTTPTNVNSLKSGVEKYEKKKKMHATYWEQDNLIPNSVVQKILNKYDLIMIKPEFFMGHIPSELPQKIREAEEKYPQSKLFMIVPHKKNVVSTLDWKTFKKGVMEEEMKRRKADPVLVAEGVDGFFIVHKWGHNFTVFRRILALVKEYYSIPIILLTLITSMAMIDSRYAVGWFLDTNLAPWLHVVFTIVVFVISLYGVFKFFENKIYAFWEAHRPSIMNSLEYRSHSPSEKQRELFRKNVFFSQNHYGN